MMPTPLAEPPNTAAWDDELLTTNRASRYLYWGAAVIGTVTPHFVDNGLRATLNVLQHRLCLATETLRGSGSGVSQEDTAHLHALRLALGRCMPAATGPIVPAGTPAASRLYEAAAVLSQALLLLERLAQHRGAGRLAHTLAFVSASIAFLEELGRWHNFRHQTPDQPLDTRSWPVVPFLSAGSEVP